MADVVVGSGENRIDPNRSSERVNSLTNTIKDGGSKLGGMLGISTDRKHFWCS